MPITMDDRVAQLGIEMTHTPAASNLNMPDMPAGTKHFRCVLVNSSNGECMVVTYSQGPGAETDPTAADVLDALASDSAGIEARGGFLAWAADYGYDVVNRNSRIVYDEIKVQTRALRRLLGDQFDEVVFNTETK